MAEKKHNPRKDRFLQSLPKEECFCDIADARGKLSFSFKYFDGSQKAGQDFKDWNDNEKTKLLNKIKEYSIRLRSIQKKVNTIGLIKE